MKLQNGLTDSEIWSRIKSGDNHSMEFVYSVYARKLYQYGLKFTRDYSVIEDSIHDLFDELIRNCKNLGNTDNILYYLLISFRRKLQRKLQKEQRFSRNEIIDKIDFDIVWSVENEIVEDETMQHKAKMLRKVLNELTPRQKEAIYLRFSKELDYKSVADIMEISVEACRNLISNSVKIMKESIRKNRGNSALLFLYLKKIIKN